MQKSIKISLLAIIIALALAGIIDAVINHFSGWDQISGRNQIKKQDLIKKNKSSPAHGARVKSVSAAEKIAITGSEWKVEGQECENYKSQGQVCSGILEPDSNVPAFWDKDKIYVFSSAGGKITRSEGPDLFNLGNKIDTTINNDKEVQAFRWLEAAFKDPNTGRVHGFYHSEPWGLCPNLTAPEIGAMYSDDNGLNWQDLGVILKAESSALACSAANGFFAGGHGDFSVIPDRQRQFVYILFSTYVNNPENLDDTGQQGLAIARIAYADINNPVGKTWKFYQGKWQEPGLSGKVTPIFMANRSWHNADPEAFWGPAIHWNTHLKSYVMLLNHTKDSTKDGNGYWAPEGMYISYNQDISNPLGWTKPEKILNKSELTDGYWYPEVIGTSKGETDRELGRSGRLFIHGKSNHIIEFGE